MSGRFWILLTCGLALTAASGFQAEISDWRKNREARLKADGGWLSLAGLFWLHEGANPFGTGSGNEIVLPDGPAQAGVVELHRGKVTAVMNGNRKPIAHDSEDLLKVGRLSLFVIQRGDRFGIRLNDPESQYRREFHGIDYFPASEAWRVSARFVAEPHKIPILNVLGQTEESDCPGYALFRLNGKEYRLYPIIEEPGDKQLFYIFRDLTAGRETYGGGRFLYSALPENGRVTLDFNKAYNPPCVFTPYATCPVPPKENHLPVRIEAGEKKYHD